MEKVKLVLRGVGCMYIKLQDIKQAIDPYDLLDEEDKSKLNKFDVDYIDYIDKLRCNGYRDAPVTVFWIDEVMKLSHDTIREIASRIKSGESMRGISYDTLIPYDVIYFIKRGLHPAHPEPVVVPEHLKPKAGRPKGRHKAQQKYEKELTPRQEQMIIDSCKQLLVKGEEEITIKFPALVLPPSTWPSACMVDPDKVNNWMAPMTRTFRIKNLLQMFSRQGKIDISEKEINLLCKKAKELRQLENK